MLEQDSIQNSDGGLIPTSPHQNVEIKSFIVKTISFIEAKEFCKLWHYSHSCPACKYLFGLYAEDSLIGVMAFGYPAMRNQIKCYSASLELRRLCCIDASPKNTESYFIGRCFKELKKNGFRGNIISLADPDQGHQGTIYKATNFKYLGVERGGGSRKIFIDGEQFHSRSAFAKFGVSGKKGLEKLFPNKKIEVIDTSRKHVYLYEIK